MFKRMSLFLAVMLAVGVMSCSAMQPDVGNVEKSVKKSSVLAELQKTIVATSKAAIITLASYACGAQVFERVLAGICPSKYYMIKMIQHMSSLHQDVSLLNHFSRTELGLAFSIAGLSALAMGIVIKKQLVPETTA